MHAQAPFTLCSLGPTVLFSPRALVYLWEKVQEPGQGAGSRGGETGWDPWGLLISDFFCFWYPQVTSSLTQLQAKHFSSFSDEVRYMGKIHRYLCEERRKLKSSGSSSFWWLPFFFLTQCHTHPSNWEQHPHPALTLTTITLTLTTGDTSLDLVNFWPVVRLLIHKYLNLPEDLGDILVPVLASLVRLW